MVDHIATVLFDHMDDVDYLTGRMMVGVMMESYNLIDLAYTDHMTMKSADMMTDRMATTTRMADTAIDRMTLKMVDMVIDHMVTAIDDQIDHRWEKADM